MAAGPHTFMTVNVFTAEKFKGNPLAIVAVRGDALSQAKKQLLAREFGFSETVFLHDAPVKGMPRRIDIFTKDEEIPFAGHPVLGTAAYIFGCIDIQAYTGPEDRENRQAAVLLTKAGPITVFSNPYRQVQACIVPHNVHIHQHKITLDDIIEAQPQCQFIPAMEMFKKKTFPIVSIVKGMTFGLVDLTDAPEAMAVLDADRSPTAKLDEGWNAGLAGCLYYRREGVEVKEGEPTIHKIHQRVMVSGMEDPGTGSASCALACYLALNVANGQSGRKSRSLGQGGASQTNEGIEERTRSLSLGPKKEHFVFGIEQGVEMGRKCQICVEVDITHNEEGHRQVSAVMLSGRSTFMTKGELIGVY